LQDEDAGLREDNDANPNIQKAKRADEQMAK